MTTAQRMILVTAMGVTAMLVLLPPWRYTLQSFDPDGGMTTEYVTEYAPLWNPPASGSRILIGSADATGARAMIERPSVDLPTVALFAAAVWTVAGALVLALGGRAGDAPMPSDDATTPPSS